MNKKILLFFIMTCILALFALEADAHYMDGLSGIMGATLTAPVSYGPGGDAFGTGLDVNGWFLFVLNGGLAYRHWYGDGVLKNNNSDRIRDEYGAYLGVGSTRKFQIQFGLSNAGTSFRVRTEVLVGHKSGGGYERGPLVIAPFIEVLPWAENAGVIFGVGIGVSGP